MATTSKYFILPSAGENFLDFELSYGSLSLQGQEIVFVGSAAVDMVFLRPGITLDFSLSGSSADKVYLSGRFADYTATINGSVMTLTRGSGATLETLRFVKSSTSQASDLLVFADGTVSSFDLYDHLKNSAQAPIPTGENSTAPNGGAASGIELNASLKAFALDANGETFAVARPGMTLTLIGSIGVDTVYIPDGATVDATLLGSSTDLIHFRGNWADYTKTIAGSTITFSRLVGNLTESVKVIGGSGGLNDRLIFADGAVFSSNAKTALASKISAAISEVTGYDPQTLTPGLDRDAPVLASAEVNGDVLTLHYTEAGLLATDHVPAMSEYVVTVTPPAGSPAAVSVSTVILSGNNVILSLASSVANGSTVTVSYIGTSLQDTSGNLALTVTNQSVSVPSGTLADGYIRDARIWIDTNGDGTADFDTGVNTNASGNFFLPPGTPPGTIIAIGGVNIDTGIPNTLVYKAPAGSTTVSPLTTLIQTYADTNSVSATAAETVIQTALGLPSGVNLLTFDPLAASPTDADAVAVQKAAAQIATIATLAASAPASGSTATAAANEVIANLVTTVTSATAGSVDLGNTTTATSLLGSSTTANSTDVAAAVTSIENATNLSGISTAQSLALDNTAPAAPIAAPDLLATSDTGRLSNDDITSDTTPTVRVRLNITALDGTAAVVGDTVKVFDGATTQVATVTLTETDIMNGYVDVTTSTLTPTTHTLTATLTDVALNLGPASAGLNLLIDTSDPTKTISGMALSADTGSSATDRVTKTAAQTITATISGTLAADERLYGSTDGGATWKDINSSVTGTSINWKGVTLTSGLNNLAIQVRDLAGNAGTTTSQTFTLDTVVPLAPTLLFMTDPNSVMTGDVMVGGIETDATWEYSLNGGATWQAGTSSGFTLPPTNYPIGAVKVRQTDLAGNVSSTASNATALSFDPAPLFQSAAVNGSTLTLTYGEALDATHAPASSAFTVQVDGSARTVSGVSVSGSAVTLTLASAVNGGQTVTVAYSDPTTGNDINAVQDAQGNDAVSLGATSVINNSPDLLAPVLASAAIVGDVLTLTYNEAIDPAHMPSASYFSLWVNGGTLNGAIETVSVNGAQVRLTLRVGVAQGDTIRISYKDPSAGDDTIAVQDLAGNDAASIPSDTIANVTNNTPADNGDEPGLVSAKFTEDPLLATATVSLTFNETMQATQLGSMAVYKNGTGSNILTGLSGISGGVVTFTTNTTLGAGDYVVVSYFGGGDLRDLQNNYVTPASIVIGGSGTTSVDLSNGVDWSVYAWPITFRGNEGSDSITGYGTDDRLIGGTGADTLSGGWGEDVINLSEPLSKRSSDTVRTVDANDNFGSPTFMVDTVIGFDVSGTATNDKLDLASKTIAADTNGDVTGTQPFGNFAKHSITNGILTLKDSSGNAIRVFNNANEGNTYAANQYLLANLVTPGEAVGLDVDMDNDGQADSLAVYQYHGSDLEMNTLVLLQGVTNVSLGNSAGQNVLQIVDSTGPTVSDAVLTDNLTNDTLTLKFSEALSAFNPTGLTIQKVTSGGTVTALSPSAPVISGNNVTITTNGDLAATDYLLIKGNATVTDAASNTVNLFSDGETGVALGASGNSFIDLSSQIGFYSLVDYQGGNDILIASNDGAYMQAGAGNDSLSGRAGNDELDGGAGADLLTGGGGMDEFRFQQGDSTTFAFNNGTYTFASGVDIVRDLKDAGDSVVIYSGDKINADMTWMNNFTGAIGDQQGAKVQGNFSSGVFTADASGTDTLIVYDGNAGSAVVNSGVVLLDVTPGQFVTQTWSNALYIERLDTMSPLNTGASFSNTLITFVFDETVTAENAAGVSFSLNPSEANGWQGTQLDIIGSSGLGTNTLTFTTSVSLSTSDVVRMQYNSALGSLRDLAGNFAGPGEVWIGGSGNNTIDLGWYWPWLGGTVTLRGNEGADRLVGTANNDKLVDGGGADTLAGSWGADLIALVEDGSTIPFSRDTVKIGVGESYAFFQGVDAIDTNMDMITGSAASPATTGFDISSATASAHDVLDLASNKIAVNASHADGIDSGSFAKHSIVSGIVTLEDINGVAIRINDGNAHAAAAYLTANFTSPGVTCALKMDANWDGKVDSLVIFQDHGLTLPDTVVLIKNLNGIAGATLGNTEGANVVQIIDTHAPDPVSTSLTGNTFALSFAEDAYATTSLALSILKNGTAATSITSISGNGTAQLGIVTNQTFEDTDWVLMNYSGSNTTDGIRDAANNVLTGPNDANFGGFVIAGSGSNSIDLSGISFGGKYYDISGYGGDDVIVGSSGGNWIVGGAGADLMTGGQSSDEYGFEQGDSPAVTGLDLGSNGILDNGDIFSFANGVDRITNFASGDSMELNRPNSDVLGGAGDPGFMGGWGMAGVSKAPPADGKATDQAYYVVRGGYSGTSFTVSDAGADTLIVWDGDASASISQTGVVLSGVTPDQLELYPESNWITHVI